MGVKYTNEAQKIVKKMDDNWEGKKKPMDPGLYFRIRKLLREVGGYPIREE